MAGTLSESEMNVLKMLITKYRVDKSSSIIKFCQQNGLEQGAVTRIINKFEERGLVLVIRKNSWRDVVLVTDKAIMYYSLRRLSAKLYNEDIRKCADMFEKIYSDFKILMNEKKEGEPNE
jgi:DNA-binding MarR family transcriptional regulator